MPNYIGPDAKIYDNADIYDNAVVYGNAKIYGNAIVYGNAEISGNAEICGNANIKSTADYITIGPAISSGRFTTAHVDSKIGVRVNTGCFSGSVDEFIAAIHETHANNPRALKQYLGFVACIKAHFDIP